MLVRDRGAVDQVAAVVADHPAPAASARPPSLSGGDQPRPWFHAQRAGRQRADTEARWPRHDARCLGRCLKQVFIAQARQRVRQLLHRPQDEGGQPSSGG
jgi:hypothetical protein